MNNTSNISTKPRVIAASLTPCQSPGEIDPQGMAHLSRELISHGCDGLFVISSTGEMPFLDEQERIALIAAARQGINESKIDYTAEPVLYAGVSGTGLKQTIHYAKEAAHAGADVAVVMAPFFLRYDQPQLLEYIRRIADVSDLPIAIYHHHRATSSFEEETVIKLASHPNVVAIKDTSRNMDRINAIIQATLEQEFSVYQGSEPILMDSFKTGAHGGVTALANICPEWHHDLVEAIYHGKYEAAIKIQGRITALWRMFRMEETSQSFAHFAYTLRYSGYKRGFLSNTVGMVTGFKPDLKFKEHLEEHLQKVKLLSA